MNEQFSNQNSAEADKGKKGIGGFLCFAVFLWICAVFAIPNYIEAKYVSKQSEAKINLEQIYLSQREYKSVKNAFARELGQLNWNLPEKGIYTYRISEANENIFTAMAIGNIDSDPFLDQWSDNESMARRAIKDDRKNGKVSAKARSKLLYIISLIYFVIIITFAVKIK